MGRRPSDAEGNRACLAENDPGEVLEFAANLYNQCLACRGVWLATFLPLDQQGLDAGGS